MSTQSFHTAPVAFVVIKENGQICQNNKYAETLFGCSNNELINTSILDLVSMDDRDKYNRYCAANRDETLGWRGGFGVEIRASRKDESEVRVFVTVLAVETPEGHLFAHAIQNVANAGVIDDDARDYPDSDDLVRHITNGFPIPFAYADADQRLLYNNASFELFFARQRGKLIGKLVNKVFDEENIAVTGSHIDSVLTGKKVHLEKILRVYDGSTHTVYLTLEPDTGADEKVVGFYLYLSHIDESTKVDNSSRQARDELETILNNVPTYIFYKDTQNVILRANKAAAQSLGVTPDEMEGCPSDQFYPEHADRYYMDDLEVIRSGRPKLGIVEPLKVSHNQIRWIETSKIPIRNGSEQITGILVLASDITERKLAEQALQKTKSDAEQANSAKSRFLAAASHDLRQPLQTISLLTGSLSKTLDDPQTQRNLDELKSAVGTMRDLLDTYLDISKLDSGIILPEISEFGIDSIFNRIRLRFQRQAEKKGIALHVVPSAVTIRSDPTLLEQLVQNFVDNAIRYTQSGIRQGLAGVSPSWFKVVYRGLGHGHGDSRRSTQNNLRGILSTGQSCP
ncbi:MAG: PAS domain S-box protein [Pseudomonadota bacterium]|nr:PAS domain S-box protein [Pseudomonadota bacterium]